MLLNKYVRGGMVMITWLNNFHKDVNNFLNFVKDGPRNPENTEGNTGIRIMLWLATGFLFVLLLISGICTFSLYRKIGALLPDIVGMIYYTGNLFFGFVFVLGMTLPVFKNKKMNECKVVIMRICIYLSIVYTSVFLILFIILCTVLKKNRLEAISKNAVELVVNVLLYIGGYAICLEAAIALSMKPLWEYFLALICIGIVVFVVKDLFGKLLFTGNQHDLYQYRQEIKYLDASCIAVVTVMCSIIDEMQTENEFTILLLPIVVFVGIESLRQISAYNKEKEMAFVKDVYENLCAIRRKVFPQIEEHHSAMKIRLQLPIEIYQISYEEKHYLSSLTCWRKKKMAAQIRRNFEELRTFLSEEYAVYENVEWERFKNDLERNTNNMAYLLNNL